VEKRRLGIEDANSETPRAYKKTFEDNVRARLITAGGQKTQTSKSRAREGREGMNDANGETPRASNRRWRTMAA
jgi:hypothetical protein